MLRLASVSRAASSTIGAAGPMASISTGRAASRRSTIACSRRLNSAGRTRLAMTAARMDAGLVGQPGEQIDRLGDRHLLRVVTTATPGAGRIVEDVEHPLRLVTDEADLDEVADHRGGHRAG